MILKRELYQHFPEGIGCSLTLLEEYHVGPAEPGLPGASDHGVPNHHSLDAARLKNITLVCFLQQILSRCSRTP